MGFYRQQDLGKLTAYINQPFMRLLPTADQIGIEETKKLMREKYGIGITDDEAFKLIEGIMRYLFLKGVDPHSEVGHQAKVAPSQIPRNSEHI